LANTFEAIIGAIYLDSEFDTCRDTVLNAQITAGIIDGQVPDIDRISVAYPDLDRPWNLIFATKIFLAGFIISTHAFYLSIKPRKSLDEPEI